MKAPSQDQAVACFDPECVDEAGNPSIAEPEQDGELHYYTCTTCGNDFGYQRITPQTVAVDAAGSCCLGVPEDVRRRASAATERLLQPQPPLLTIGKRPHAD